MLFRGWYRRTKSSCLPDNSHLRRYNSCYWREDWRIWPPTSELNLIKVCVYSLKHLLENSYVGMTPMHVCVLFCHICLYECLHSNRLMCVLIRACMRMLVCVCACVSGLCMCLLVVLHCFYFCYYFSSDVCITIYF